MLIKIVLLLVNPVHVKHACATDSLICKGLRSPILGGMFDVTFYARLENQHNGAENHLTDIEKREFEMLELDTKGMFEGSFKRKV
jgi:hypothetical protein